MSYRQRIICSALIEPKIYASGPAVSKAIMKFDTKTPVIVFDACYPIFFA